MSDLREAVRTALESLSELEDGAESRVVRRTVDGDAEMRVDVDARTLTGGPDAPDRTPDSTADRVVWSGSDVAVLDDPDRTGDGGDDR